MLHTYLDVEEFNNPDGSFSHYSVVHVNAVTDELEELATCIMHETREEAQAELRGLTGNDNPLRRECAETLRDLCEWDGSPDALEIIKANLRAAIEQNDNP